MATKTPKQTVTLTAEQIATMADPGQVTFLFDADSCGRCGGTGEMPWKHVHGGRCFKCGGSGRVYTRKGAKAANAMQEAKAALTAVKVADLKVGDQIMYAAGVLTVGSGLAMLPSRAYRVESIERNTTAHGGQVGPDGQVIPATYLVLVRSQARYEDAKRVSLLTQDHAVEHVPCHGDLWRQLLLAVVKFQGKGLVYQVPAPVCATCQEAHGPDSQCPMAIGEREAEA